MNVQVHPGPARLLVLSAFVLLLLGLLLVASDPTGQAQAQGSPPLQAPEGGATAQPGLAPAITPTPTPSPTSTACPYEGKTDPPPAKSPG